MGTPGVEVQKWYVVSILFATLYMCEAGFSDVAVVKTKYRSTINRRRKRNARSVIKHHTPI